MFNHAPTLESINVMAEAHLKYGTTTLFPTLITDDIDTIEQAADSVSEAIAQAHPSVEGVHLKGRTFLLRKKACTCHAIFAHFQIVNWQPIPEEILGKSLSPLRLKTCLATSSEIWWGKGLSLH